MTIRLYIDEDAMDKDLVQALRARGVDVITALDAAMIERSDEEHLEYAAVQERVLYSFNLRFPVVLPQGFLIPLSLIGEGRGEVE